MPSFDIWEPKVSHPRIYGRQKYVILEYTEENMSFLPSKTQTLLFSYRDHLNNENLLVACL